MANKKPPARSRASGSLGKKKQGDPKAGVHILSTKLLIPMINQTVTVSYQHFLPTDSCGPPDLYLQQP
jgi:hypothetical protein